jgi:hypothetical protein
MVICIRNKDVLGTRMNRNIERMIKLADRVPFASEFLQKISVWREHLYLVCDFGSFFEGEKQKK